MDFNLDDIDFDFDLGELDNVTSKSNFASVKRYKRPSVCKYKNAETLVKDIGCIGANESVFCIVSGDFIEAYLQINGLKAIELIVTTLSMSSNNVDSLKNIQQFYSADNFKLGLIISDYFFSHERTKEGGINDIIKNLGSDPGFYFAVAGIHTKITLIKTECGQHIVISGSANLRSSMNIEQITIDNSKVIYDFNREWMTDIINTYQVNHKMMRRNQLWQQVAKDVEQEKQKAGSLEPQD